jgi:hypothetical protein
MPKPFRDLVPRFQTAWHEHVREVKEREHAYEDRLSVLKRSTAPQTVPAILRSIVESGALDAPPNRAEFYGMTLERQEGEGGEAFERRAFEAAVTIPRLCMSAAS